MSLKELKKKLQHIVADDHLAIDKQIINSPQCTFIFEELLHLEQLTIENPVLFSSDEAIYVEGIASLLNVAILPIELTFFERDEMMQLAIQIICPEEWKISDSFPSVNQTLINLTSEQSFPCLLDLIQFRNVLLSVSTDSIDIDALPAWLFSAVVDSNDEQLPLSLLVDSRPQLDAVGSISSVTPAFEQVTVNLTLHIEEPVSLGFVTLADFYLEIISAPISMVVPDANEDVIIAEDYYRLQSELLIGGDTTPVILPVCASFLSSSLPYAFELMLDDFVINDLSSITPLFGDLDLNSYLPPNLSLHGSLLQITMFIVEYDPRLSDLSRIEVTVATQAQWRFSERLSIKDISLSFTVSYPTNPNQRFVSAVLRGRIEFADNLWVEVVASLPDFSLSFALESDTQFTLPHLISQFSPIELPQPDWIPDIAFESIEIMIQAREKALMINASASVNWQFLDDAIALEDIGIALELSGGNGVSGYIEGQLMLGQQSLLLTGDTAESLQLTASVESLALSDVVNELLTTVSLPATIPNFILKDVQVALSPHPASFQLSAKVDEQWQIPVGYSGILIENLSFDVSYEGDRDAQHRGFNASISGIVNIGNIALDAVYRLPGEFELRSQIPSISLMSLIHYFCGDEVLDAIQIPPSISALTLDNVELLISPANKLVSLSATSGFGQLELIINKPAQKWTFACAFSLQESWRFSNLVPELVILDSLSFGAGHIVFASDDNHGLQLSSLSSESTNAIRVTKGLNFYARMRMQGLGVDELFNIDALSVQTSISHDPSQISIEAGIQGEFELGEGVIFGGIRLRLKPAPSEFSLTLLGTLSVNVNQDKLEFVGGLQLKPRAANLQATMFGQWNEPFDFKGFALSNVAIELGLSFPPPIPSIGIKGDIIIGDFEGTAAVKFDSAMPSKSMLAVAFNQLFFMDIVTAFCQADMVQVIPPTIAQTLSSMGFEDVNIYIVPQTTTIGEFTFERGIELRGAFYLKDILVAGLLKIDYIEGIEIRGDMQGIPSTPVFSITGAQGADNPSVYLNVSPRALPVIHVSATVSLLGIQQELAIQVSDNGFYFLVSGNVFDLFESTIEVDAADLKDSGTFSIKASMKNDFMRYLNEQTTKAIRQAADEAQHDIESAQRVVDDAVAAVEEMEHAIVATRKLVREERAQARRDLQKAKRAVANQQRKIATVEKDIANEWNKLDRDISRVNRPIEGLRRDLDNAETDLATHRAKISSNNKKLSKLKKEVKKKQAWYDNLPFLQKGPANIWKLNEYVKPRELQIVALKSEALTLQGYVTAAQGIIDVSLDGINVVEKEIKKLRKTAKSAVAAMNREIAAIARGALATAQASLNTWQRTVANFTPRVDGDLRVATQIVAQKALRKALLEANEVLDDIKEGLGTLADVSEFIVNAGTGGILDVRKASFEASLQVADRGSVSLDIHYQFMNGPLQTQQLSFNFQDPVAGALRLADSLLKG
jgi:predicted  nucleic acid-binding Zn-ribbon protein